MILKGGNIELEIRPDCFEGIYLHHLSTEEHSVYRQPEEGEMDFPFREGHDNWINMEVALRERGRYEKRHYAKGAMLPEEAYGTSAWLSNIAEGTEPLPTRVAFCEPDFQDIIVTSSSTGNLLIHVDFGLGGPPFPNLDIEITRKQLLVVAEEFKNELLVMFRKYGYPLDMIGLDPVA